MPLKPKTIFNHKGSVVRTSDGQEITLNILKSNPLVVKLSNVLTDDECDTLISMSKDKGMTKVEGNDLFVGDSATTVFDVGENDFIKKLEARFSEIMCVPVERGVGLQTTLYGVDGELKEHLDSKMKNTLIMYLNDTEEGGETNFSRLNLSIAPKKGTAVYFESIDSKNNVNQWMAHSGKKVVKGEKWIVTKWTK